jgi:hypothetical protein
MEVAQEIGEVGGAALAATGEDDADSAHVASAAQPMGAHMIVPLGCAIPGTRTLFKTQSVSFKMP